ncbi:MAG: DUF177 domain-containing protein [Micavibrio aeruginosavorus]|uniref:DUF177 domain-containing protein n=1 Tax=Micavibrio aeruginosavorus TaxID=349221 RepID=A0A7T5R0G7_9BACT|nr:MAG: DUF177 domain-containing protein [Micavibrio aeruginosavorus]
MSKKKKGTVAAPEPEWSVLIDAHSVTSNAQKLRIAASEEERKALAQRLGVTAIASLSADLTLHRERGNIINVNGLMKANITQPCVVTLDPVQTQIEETFEGWYADQERIVMLAKARHDRLGRLADSEVPILDESEDPEPLINGMIDIGELVVQHLSLALDRFPRRRGLEEREEGTGIAAAGQEGEALRRNPFEALKNWKKAKAESEQ